MWKERTVIRRREEANKMVRKEEEKDILEANRRFLFLEMFKSKKNDSIKEKEVVTVQ